MKDMGELIVGVLGFLVLFFVLTHLDPTVKTSTINGNRNIAVNCLYMNQCVNRIEQYCGINNFTITHSLSWPYNVEAICRKTLK